MQREMLSHFIILSNGKSTRGDQKDGTLTCTRQVKKYTQNDKEMASLWTASKLLENCYAAATAGIKWGFGAAPLLRKCWDSGISLYSINPEKPRKLFENSWPPKITPFRICAIPQGSALPLKRILQNSAKILQYARAGPLLNFQAQILQTIPLRSSHQKRLRSPSQTVQSPNALLLRNSHKSILLQKTDETTLPEQALEVPRG